VRRHVLIERNLIGAVTPTPEAVAVPCLIDGDAVDPGAKARLSAEAPDRPEDAQKDLLREVQGFFPVAKQVDCKLDDHPLMLGDELGAGRFLARCAPLHERRFADADFGPTNYAGLLH
jgi:hypothetical protein